MASRLLVRLCRQAWQSQIRQLLQDAALWSRAAAVDKGTAEGVRGLLSVLLGDESALVAATATWLELLAALALHVYPTLRCTHGSVAAARTGTGQLGCLVIRACDHAAALLTSNHQSLG